jgi:glyoxylase-like metal-dependent hydrolase (beta-lactamase superfamily II)
LDARIERVSPPAVEEGDDVMAEDANAWVIGDDEEVIVIDPGEDASAVMAVVGDREVLAVISRRRCLRGRRARRGPGGAAPV